MKKAFVLLCCFGFFLACNSNNKPSNTGMPDPEGKVRVLQRDFVHLSQCPTNDPNLSVEVSPDLFEAVISRDGKVIQTVSDEEGLVSMGSDVAPVYFLDANFDGFTDIFIGVGESRTYSTLLLWNEEAQQFHRVGTLGDPDLQGFRLFPKEETVIQGGSGSYCSFYITQSHWNGEELVRDEQLVIISDETQYYQYDVKNKFTVQDGDEKVLISTENKDSLPEFWQAVVKCYGME